MSASASSRKVMQVTLMEGVHKLGVCEVVRGQEVQWIGYDDHPLLIWVPDDRIFVGTTREPESSGAMIAEDAPLTGEEGIHYTVYDTTAGVYVVGNSHPVMIIKEKPE